MEPELVEAQLATHAKVESQPPIVSLSKKLKQAAKGTSSTTSSCIHSCCRPRRRRTSSDRRDEPRTDDWELNEIDLEPKDASRTQQPQYQRPKLDHSKTSPKKSLTACRIRDEPKPSTSSKSDDKSVKDKS